MFLTINISVTTTVNSISVILLPLARFVLLHLASPEVSGELTGFFFEKFCFWKTIFSQWFSIIFWSSVSYVFPVSLKKRFQGSNWRQLNKFIRNLGLPENTISWKFLNQLILQRASNGKHSSSIWSGFQNNVLWTYSARDSRLRTAFQTTKKMLCIETIIRRSDKIMKVSFKFGT